MLQRKNKNLHVVKDTEERTEERKEERAEKLVKSIAKEPEDDQFIEPEKQILEHRKQTARKTAIVIVIIAAVTAALYILISLQTYTSVSISGTYAVSGSADSNYEQFAKGVIKYSRDGVSYLGRNGEEKWNQPYQIKNPFVTANSVSAAIADKGGNDIVVFQEEGVKGEIHTTLPIQKIALSEQGIVCAVLKQENTPKIICYDMAGNVLVEHKASAEGTGYPLNIALSPDGKVLQVLYLYTQNGGVTSKVVYYNFGEAGEGKTDFQVTDETYKNTVMAEAFYMSQNVSAAVGDNLLTIYKGKDVPKESVKVEIKKEIKSVFHSEKYIGLILRGEGQGGYELRIYNTSGKEVLSKEFTGDYSNVKMCGNQIIMYDGSRCSIFTKRGVHKFEGEADHTILEIFPVAGVNKYIMMSADGMEHIRIVK